MRYSSAHEREDIDVTFVVLPVFFLVVGKCIMGDGCVSGLA